MKAKFLFIALIFTIIFSCKKELNSDPTLTTDFVKVLSASTCYVKSTVTERGSYDILDYGFVCSESKSSLSINYGTKISFGKNLVSDTFSCVIPYITNNSYYTPSSYYVRAYLTNTRGTIYGLILSFNPLILSVSSVYPKSGKVGDSITIIGNNFSSVPDYNVVKLYNNSLKIGEVSVTSINNVSSSNISAYVPYMNAGTYDVEVYNGISKSILSKAFTVIVPEVISISPTSGSYGTEVTILGKNFNSNANVFINYSQYNNIYTDIIYKDSSKIIITIPYGITTGNVKLNVVFSSNLTFTNDFTIEPLLTTISNFTPNSGTPGTAVTINGSGFVQDYTTRVNIGTISSYIISISSKQIKVQVPSNAGLGPMKISVETYGNTVISDNNFTILWKNTFSQWRKWYY